MQSEKEKWRQAREIRRRLRTETRQDLIAAGYSNGTVSMAPRALNRRSKFQLKDWTYLSICATLTIPDELFPGFLEATKADARTPVREVKRLTKAYKAALPKKEIHIRTDTDYIMKDGRRYWLSPADAEKVMDMISDHLWEG